MLDLGEKKKKTRHIMPSDMLWKKDTLNVEPTQYFDGHVDVIHRIFG